MPFSVGFHGESVCNLVSSYLDMRLYLDDRGMLLTLGAYEQLLYDGLKNVLCLWYLCASGLYRCPLMLCIANAESVAITRSSRPCHWHFA